MKVLTFGEIMLRLKSVGYEQLFQTPMLEATFGGGEANVAVSIKYRLLLYFFTLIMLPIITLGIIGNIIYSKILETQTTAHTSEIINQVNKSIESDISEIEKIIKYISAEPAVTRIGSRF